MTYISALSGRRIAALNIHKLAPALDNNEGGIRTL